MPAGWNAPPAPAAAVLTPLRSVTRCFYSGATIEPLRHTLFQRCEQGNNPSVTLSSASLTAAAARHRTRSATWRRLTRACVRVFVHQSRQLESETGTTEEHSLNKEARKWATRVAREHKNIIHYKRVRRRRSQMRRNPQTSFLISDVFYSILFLVSGGVRQPWLTAHRAGTTGSGAEDRGHQRKHSQGRGLSTFAQQNIFTLTPGGSAAASPAVAE